MRRRKQERRGGKVWWCGGGPAKEAVKQTETEGLTLRLSEHKHTRKRRATRRKSERRNKAQGREEAGDGRTSDDSGGRV